MKQECYLKNLTPPEGLVDAVLDTDAYNEADDQFAIAYLLASGDRIRLRGITAAPFSNWHSDNDPKLGMERSYDEILKLLSLAGREEQKESVYRGATGYLPDEKTPVESEACDFLGKLAKEYSPEHPLYVVAIGAITNVASAILKYPEMKENTVVVWLGGHAPWWSGTGEFNMMQDVAAARVVFGCGVPLVQLPCAGVVDRFSTTKYELLHWLQGKNPLADYLCEYMIRDTEGPEEQRAGKKETPWDRVIWDVTAVAWLLNDNGRFLKSRLVPAPIPEYDHHYAADPRRHWIAQVHEVRRSALMTDLFEKIADCF